MSFTINDYLKDAKNDPVPQGPEQEQKMGFSDHPPKKCYRGCECC